MSGTRFVKSPKIRAAGKLDAAVHLAPEYNELLPERGVGFKLALRLEERGQQVQGQENQRDHRGQREAILSLVQYGSGFRYTQVFGATDKPGPYVVLIKWHPGYMSAPHTYETDRLCFVISGTWWVNSGENFEPEATVPVPAGGFVRRVAHTPHYDGVKKGPQSSAFSAKPRSSSN